MIGISNDQGIGQPNTLKISKQKKTTGDSVCVNKLITSYHRLRHGNKFPYQNSTKPKDGLALVQQSISANEMHQVNTPNNQSRFQSTTQKHQHQQGAGKGTSRKLNANIRQGCTVHKMNADGVEWNNFKSNLNHEHK